MLNVLTVEEFHIYFWNYYDLIRFSKRKMCYQLQL